MRGQLVKLALGVLLYACMAAPAQAATVAFSDVPATSWARTQITWSAANGWMAPRTTTTFGPGKAATRLAAARVLAHLAHAQNGTPIGANPYAQAVTAGWIIAGTGADQQITQLEFDRGVVRVLGLMRQVTVDRPPADRRRLATRLPDGFGIEQIVQGDGRTRQRSRRVGRVGDLAAHARCERANLAAQAYALGHLCSWALQDVIAKAVVQHALPAWSPLQKAVIGMALRYAGAPYVWGGTSPTSAVSVRLPRRARRLRLLGLRLVGA